MTDLLRCRHGILWPWECNPCDNEAWAAHKAALAAAASGGDAKQAPGDSPAERPEGQRPTTVRQQREGKR